MPGMYNAAAAGQALLSYAAGAVDPFRTMAEGAGMPASMGLWGTAGNGGPPSPSPSPSAGLVQLSNFSLFLCALLVLLSGAVSVWLQLQLEVKLLVAAIRCVLQLSVLGYILVPIFKLNTWWIVVSYSSFMVLVAASEAAGRPSLTHKGLFLNVLLALGSSSGLALTYCMFVVVDVKPWWEAQYFIPLLGMLLGNCVSGVSVGLATVMEDLSSGKDRIDILLALGASRMEAVKATLQRAMMVALTPVLNQMSVVGIVAIPGMMTGQILGGSDPSEAARYQMMIMFLITATSTVGSLISVLGSVLVVVDNCHRIRPDRLHAESSKRGVSGAVNWAFQQVIDGVTFLVMQLVGAIGQCVWVLRGRPASQELLDPLMSLGSGSKRFSERDGILPGGGWGQLDRAEAAVSAPVSGEPVEGDGKTNSCVVPMPDAALNGAGPSEKVVQP